MNTQLVGMIFEGEVYYGELSDAHIFRGTDRRIVYDALTCIPIPAEWKAYLDHLPHIDIERADGSWGQSLLWGHERALQTPHGYIIPIVELHYAVGAKAFPRMFRRWEIQPLVQGHVPTVHVRSTTKSKVYFSEADKSASLKSASPKSDASKHAAVQTVTVKPRLVKRRRSSMDSTDAVSEKAPVPRIHIRPIL